MTGSTAWVVFPALVVVILLGLYLRGLAGRLDRLHVRVEAAHDALDVQLARRASATLELVASGLLDPATSMVLTEAAYAADAAGDGLTEPGQPRVEDPSWRQAWTARELAESELSQALRAAFDEADALDELAGSPAALQMAQALGQAGERVVMARRFNNDAVRATRALRGHWVVRTFRLAGSARLPRFFEMDDAPPQRLSGGRVE